MVAEGFVVHPEALKGYSGLVQRNAGYLTAMSVHLDDSAGLEDSLQGLMYLMGDVVRLLSTWQRGILTEMNRKLSDTGSGLRSTANGYANTDARTAEKMDKTMPYSDDGQNPGRGPI